MCPCLPLDRARRSWRSRRRIATPVIREIGRCAMRPYVLLLAFGLGSSAAARTPPVSLFTTLGLTSEEIAAVDAGRSVAKVLPWGGPSEVYVFGAIHVDGSPDTYLNAARDVRRLSGTPGYLGIGE